jgi:hypothetical protein
VSRAFFVVIAQHKCTVVVFLKKLLRFDTRLL